MINRTAKTRHTRRHKPYGPDAATLIDTYLTAHPTCPPAVALAARLQRTDTVELPRLIATTAVTA